MADDGTDQELQALINSLSAAGQYANGSGAVGGANAAQLAAYQAVIQNLKDRFGDYKNLAPADYKNITAQQLGPSALAGIQPDAQARGDEQAAIAQLQDISDRGGLSLADTAALDRLQQNLGRNNSARQNSLANQYAARGQLGSGAELSMDLANNQNAAMNANQMGESTAAQAQQRAMQAVLQKAAASRSMSNDDYARKKAAAEAADAIAAHNASARTDASKYNNNIAGQTFDDSLKKLQGETGLTGSLNTALLGQGDQRAAGIAGQGAVTDKLIGGLAQAGGGIIKGLGKGGGGGTGDYNAPAPGESPGQWNSYPGDSSSTADQVGTKLSDTGIDESAGAGDLDWESLAGSYA